MTGLSDAISMLHHVLWADAELRRIQIEYGELHLLIREATGGVKRLVCEGYTGYELVGFWDEVVVANVEVRDSGSFLERCETSIESRLGTSRAASGSEARNREHGLQLVLTLDDGCQLQVAMRGLRVEVA